MSVTGRLKITKTISVSPTVENFDRQSSPPLTIRVGTSMLILSTDVLLINQKGLCALRWPEYHHCLLICSLNTVHSTPEGVQFMKHSRQGDKPIPGS